MEQNLNITSNDIVNLLDVCNKFHYQPAIVRVSDEVVKLITISFGCYDANKLLDAGYHFTSIYADGSKLEVWIRKIEVIEL